MATSLHETKVGLLEAVVARAHESFEAAEAEPFVRAYYANVAAEDLRDRSESDLAGAVLAHWGFARVRRVGESKVRVYTPRLEEHGWESPYTVVETVVDDMPFLVDSVSMEVSRHGRAIHHAVRPIMAIRRDEEGRLVEVGAEDAHNESLIHLELDRLPDAAAHEELRDDLQRVLGDVRAAVEDWSAMRQRTKDVLAELAERPPPVDAAELDEARAFLTWLEDDHFTFLGYREYDIDDEDALHSLPASGLGILRQSEGEAPRRAPLPPEVARLARKTSLLNLTKANSRSTVHRPVYLDYVGIKRFDDAGEVTGERRFLGLYTHTTYRVTPWEIPVVRRKAEEVLERSELLLGSHDHKALVEILETYPRDALFQISEDELFESAMGILHLGERRRVRLFVRRDTYGRFVSCLVLLPRDRFNTDNRRKVEAILQEAFDGTSVDYETHVSASVLARLHYVIYTEPERAVEYDVDEIERRIATATREWTDDLLEAVGAGPLFERYRDAFPSAYREDFSARQALFDIQRMEQLTPEDDLAMSLYVPHASAHDHLAFKLLRSALPIVLSDVLPLLEKMGVKVTDERPYEVRPADGQPVWIYDFGLQLEEDVDVDDVREIFQDAFARVWRGEVESDGFNRLVIRARLTAREIMVLRAVAKYLRQAGSTFSQNYMEDALVAHPTIARGLVELFHDATTDTSTLEAAIDEVESLDEDRILRSFLTVIRAVVRTNYHDAKPYLALKLDPQLIPDLPEPRPTAEVWVYSPRVEAVHLRAGRVARGGIRWSDRREDFRTEVLGLMKAQTLKNAVIVPTGAKGGFVVKRAGDEVVECYRIFIRGLLDVTDEDDPYLVVAADKGTATFSDVANAISLESGFWLGDAFASGGSTGYDHKAMGITARGAWKSVERHFAEIGLDGEFTVVGVGDMSGDVFGNGMLLSKQLKLIAAFDHRHVFVDPTPDPEASFAERRRLFETPRSSWADYNPKLISQGGGVFPRSAKSIALLPEARAALGIDAEALSPSDLIRAILRAPVDLLFNGGIGTYVKASDERHADVGDKTNDAVRVDASELRSRVVGEGGNLGFTQRARVEYALRGGRIFMDAIDNSAGVDCSDHEVNIKILLDTIVRDGDLTEKQRNELLAEMTDEVGELVLRDNYEQARALTTSIAQAAPMVEVHERYIDALEESGALNRELEFLPSEEALAERKAAARGLTAPEFAILLSYTKNTLAEALLASDLEDDALLRDYFPTPLRDRFPEQLLRHPLRREIVAARAANDLVNHCGTSFAFRLQDETGTSAADIVRAYTAAVELFDLRAIWAEIEALDGKVAAAVTQTSMLLKVRVLLERTTRWLLQNRRRPLDVGEILARYGEATSTCANRLSALLDSVGLEAAQSHALELVSAGVPQELAERVSFAEALVPTLDVAEIAATSGVEATSVAEVYYALGGRLDLHWLRERIVALPRETRWDAMVRAALRDDLYSEQAALTAVVIREASIDAWAAQHEAAIERCLDVLGDIKAAGADDLARLSVAVREIRNLTHSSGTTARTES